MIWNICLQPIVKRCSWAKFMAERLITVFSFLVTYGFNFLVQGSEEQAGKHNFFTGDNCLPLVTLLNQNRACLNKNFYILFRFGNYYTYSTGNSLLRWKMSSTQRHKKLALCLKSWDNTRFINTSVINGSIQTQTKFFLSRNVDGNFYLFTN